MRPASREQKERTFAAARMGEASRGIPNDKQLYVEELKLTDFRNYERAALTLDASPVVLVGDNGAGKTNLMEAVSLLGPGRRLPRFSKGTHHLPGLKGDVAMDLRPHRDAAQRRIELAGGEQKRVAELLSG